MTTPLCPCVGCQAGNGPAFCDFAGTCANGCGALTCGGGAFCPPCAAQAEASGELYGDRLDRLEREADQRQMANEAADVG